jgi:hypothetical protein
MMPADGIIELAGVWLEPADGLRGFRGGEDRSLRANEKTGVRDQLFEHSARGGNAKIVGWLFFLRLVPISCFNPTGALTPHRRLCTRETAPPGCRAIRGR